MIDTAVCEKNNTPPVKGQMGKAAFRAPTSGAGSQFLLLNSKAKAHAKRLFFSQTLVSLGVSMLHRGARWLLVIGTGRYR